MSSSVFPGSILFFSGYPIAHSVLKIHKKVSFVEHITNYVIMRKITTNRTIRCP